VTSLYPVIYLLNNQLYSVVLSNTPLLRPVGPLRFVFWQAVPLQLHLRVPVSMVLRNPINHEMVFQTQMLHFLLLVSIICISPLLRYKITCRCIQMAHQLPNFHGFDCLLPFICFAIPVTDQQSTQNLLLAWFLVRYQGKKYHDQNQSYLPSVSSTRNAKDISFLSSTYL
jgi:hypothetical protein